MKLKAVSFIIMGIMLFTMVISACMPPAATAEELAAMEKARKDSVRKANSRYCMKHLSFATEYYKNKAYPDAIFNYKKLFDYECVDEDMAQNVYVYIANSYRELDNLDTALMYYDEGLTVIPQNEYLWDNKIFLLKLMGNGDAVLETKIEKYEHFPADSILGLEITEDYLTRGMYDEARALAEKLQLTDPQNSNLSNIIFQCVLATGGDILGLLKTKYEENPSDIPNAKAYAVQLDNVGETGDAINIWEGILNISPGMTDVMNYLVEALGKIGETKKLINMLKMLNTSQPGEIQVYFQMTDAYISDGELKSAMSWAGKALSLDQNNGQAYANRAAVFEAVGIQCAGPAPDFDDKLVFMMAYEDYLTAKAKGYYKVNNKIDFLKEARIPQSGDWFFNRDDYVRGGKASTKKECYAWLKRSVTAPTK
ncbi:MAG: hypothetical protein HQ508_01525 [Candidatus Marinimicrobia bacterium]|nr:hypothetical protein [Candidatus Neomarinimicrobiota bacterium]